MGQRRLHCPPELKHGSISILVTLPSSRHSRFNTGGGDTLFLSSVTLTMHCTGRHLSALIMHATLYCLATRASECMGIQGTMRGDICSYQCDSRCSAHDTRCQSELKHERTSEQTSANHNSEDRHCINRPSITLQMLTLVICGVACSQGGMLGSLGGIQGL